ncbi:MAG: hypothetical protein QMD04_12315 [Anaerolineales bacterium]|nr:hypothetical protein [Anaerolineales bacterium]
MSTKTIGLALLIIGILVLAVSLLADYLGLGSGPVTFGWKQWLGAGVGLVVALAGLGFILRRKKS